MARRKAMKEERLQSAADREEPSGPFSPLSTGPASVERWNLSHFFNNIHTVSTPRSKSSKRLHISLGIEKLRAQAFLLCTEALCIKCIGSPTILLLEFMHKCRTWFIISIPWIRLRDFLSSCLKIFMSESICFTKSWNSLVSLPCCTLGDQKWGDSLKKNDTATLPQRWGITIIRIRQPPCSKPDRGSCGKRWWQYCCCCGC